MYRILCIAAILLTTLPACKKDKKLNTTPTVVDSMVVHRIWGMVPYGYGHRTFLITEDKLWEDTMHRYADTSTYNFNKQLPDAQLQLAKGLLSAMPAFMLQQPKTVMYGDPHFYADGTATYIIAYKNGVRHACLISDAMETVPETVKPFAEKVEKAYIDLQ